MIELVTQKEEMDLEYIQIENVSYENTTKI